MMNIKTLTGSTLLALSLTLSGCGGGGGGGNSNNLSGGAQFSGNNDPAEVTGENVEDIGRAAGEAVIQAYNSDEAPSPIGVAIESKPFDVVEFAKGLLATDMPPALPSAATTNLSEECSSGSWFMTHPNDPNATSGNFTMTFNDCVLEANTTYDGKIYMYFEDVEDPDADFRIRYENFSYTSPEYSINNLNYTIECINGECTELSDFESEDGHTHRISHFSIEGDPETGINGTATFYHEVHGVVDITIEDLTFGGECSPYPESGTISFESETGSSGFITFNDDPCSVTSDWDSGDI